MKQNTQWRVADWETARRIKQHIVTAKGGAKFRSSEIDGNTITFKFKNGAVINRIFNNETNRKETWARKAGGM